MRHGLYPTNNLLSGQEYKYISNSRQLGQGRAKWGACGTEQSPGQNGVKVCGGEEGRVLLQDSNPLTWWVLESPHRFATRLRTKWMLDAA